VTENDLYADFPTLTADNPAEALNLSTQNELFRLFHLYITAEDDLAE
jgi:hypothetical protein